jgi:hypothetical protein
MGREAKVGHNKLLTNFVCFAPLVGTSVLNRNAE